MQPRAYDAFEVVVPIADSRPRFRISEVLMNNEVALYEHNELWIMDDFAYGEEDDMIIHCTSEPIPWRDFCRYHVTTSTTSAKSAPKRPKVDPKIIDALLTEFPWLTEADLGLRTRSRKSGSSSSKAKRIDEDDSASESDHVDGTVPTSGGLDDIAHVDLEALGKELIELREKWADCDYEDMLFYVANRGGKWLHLTKNKTADTATCYCRASAIPFCDKFHWPKQKSYAYGKYKGVENANQLAKECARRGHHFASIWLISGSDDSFVFTDAHVIEDDEAFLNCLLALDHMSDMFAEAVNLRKLFPVP
jgi:hypothetical protein